MRSKIFGLASFSSLFLVSAAHGDVLFEINTDVHITNSFFVPIPFVQFSPNISIEKSHNDSAILARVFSGLQLTPADAGKTFISSPLTDPGFITYAKYLTDGKDQFPIFTDGPGGSSGTTECNWFHGDHTCLHGVDLQGYAIDQITYTMKGWVNDIPGRNLNGDGQWYDLYYGHRLTIEGHAIPEPAGLVLALLMAAGGLSISRRRFDTASRHARRPAVPK